MKQVYEVSVEVDKSRPFKDETGAGFYILETWKQNGLLSRHHGPAVSYRHPATDVIAYEEYCEDGLYHRLGRPAITQRNPLTGEVVAEHYMERGKEVSPPAHISLEPTLE